MILSRHDPVSWARTLLACVWLLPAAAPAQSLQTIVSSGPVSNRLNIAVLSEGYTSAQLPQFLVDATNSVNALLSHPPYAEYQSYFNAFAISVPSTQSGSDHPADPTARDTYFNSSYDAFDDRLITIPPNAQDTDYSHGQGKVAALLQTFLPDCHLPILLVNDVVPGGSDGFDQTAIAAIGGSSAEYLTHETGHVLANLGDEYSTAYPEFPDTEEPNTTRETNRARIKWTAWIASDTPLPTPPAAPFFGVVGLFEGAHYHPSGWYRPQLNCKMGSVGSPFCDVCREAMVLALYQRVRPVDAFTPATTNFAASPTQALAFSVTLLRPAAHALTVQWFTNHSAVSGATNSVFEVRPQTLGDGVNLIQAVVHDPTPLVRNDPLSLLSQTVTWTANINPPLWLACPSNLVIQSQSLTGAVATFTASVSDACPNVTLEFSPPSGSVFPIGVTPVQVLATHACGANTAACAFNVTVFAPTPVLTCPSNIVLEFQSPTGAVATFTAAVSDSCTNSYTAFSPPSGSVFPIGVTVVQVLATDGCGPNSAACAFNVTVLGAQSVKLNILAQLTLLRAGSTNRADQKGLDSAVKKLAASLAPNLWVDDAHLVRKKGGSVFRLDVQVVAGLRSLLRSKKGLLPHPDLQSAIDELVNADRLLAAVSLSEAAGDGVQPRTIALEQKEFAKGDAFVAAGKFSTAIPHYLNAWNHPMPRK